MILLLAIILLVLYLIPTYEKPKIVRGLVTPEEREHIMKRAEKKLAVSTVAENRVIDKKIRDSETAWLDMSDPVVKRVCEKCVSLTDRPLDNCEHLQVLRYRPGGHYKPHQDTFSDTKGNKRMYTVILALNDDYEGGETEFPNLKKKYKMRAGDALFFHTLDNYELIDIQGFTWGSPCKVW
jgi:predicted 2-oxoglutarate/Fe(II)-dependent dioxygenase YbiX